MSSFSFEIAIKLFSGGLVGYITNLLAIKMLFKEYPLIGGGVILKTYNELKDQLSELVERDLVNHHTIKNELEDPIFRESLHTILEYFSSNSLKKNLEDKKVSEIVNYNQIIENLTSKIIEEKVFEDLDLKNLLSDIHLKDILGEQETQLISEKAFDLINQVIYPEINNFTFSVYEENKSNKLEDILGTESFNKAKENLHKELDSIHIKVREFDGEIEDFLEKVINRIGLKESIDKIEEHLNEKTLSEIVGNESKNKIVDEIYSILINLVDSDEGDFLLNALSESIITIAKDIDRPIIQFLSPDLQEKIKSFVENNIIYLADSTKIWIQKNKKELESLVENSIEEYYSGQKTVGAIKLAIKDIIGLKVSEYFNIVEKGVEHFDNYINNKAPEDISNQLINFLKNKKTGELITDIGLTKDKLKIFLHELLKTNLEKKNLTIINSFFDKKIKEIKLVNSSLSDLLEPKLNRFIINQIKERFLYSSFFSNQLKNIFDKSLNRFDLETFFNKDKLNGYLGLLPFLFMFGKGKVISVIKESLSKEIDSKKLSDLIPENFDNTYKNLLSEWIPNALKSYLLSLGEKEVLVYCNKLFEKVDLSKQTDFLILKTSNNLEKIMSGRISKGVRNELNKFSSAELRDKVEDFMGKELQPITWLGAFLGALSGGALYFTEGIPEVSYLTTTNLSLITIPSIYAFVGIGTNWLAIEMLFKPYETIKLMGIKMPFTPGIVGKRKPQFAENMGNFVSRELINENTVRNIFNNSVRHDITNFLISKEQVVIDQVKSNKNNILSWVENFINNVSRTDIFNKIYSKIESIKTRDIGKNNIEKGYTLLINKISNFLSDFLFKQLLSFKDKKINDLSDSVKEKINSSLLRGVNKKTEEKLNLLKEANPEKLNDILNDLDSIINKDVKLSSLFSDEKSKHNLVEHINTFIKDKVVNGLEIYIKKVLVSEELSPDKKVKDLFNGQLIEFLKNQVFLIIESIVFVIAIEKLKDEKHNISEKIINSINQSDKSLLYDIGSIFFSFDDDIRAIVHLLIEEKLEVYLKDKKYELENILNGYTEFISNKSLKDISLSGEMINIENIEGYLTKFLNNQNISIGIENTSLRLYNSIFDISLKKAMYLFDFESLSSINDRFSNEVNSVLDILNKNISDTKDLSDKELEILIPKLSEKLLYTIDLNKIFENLDENELKNGITLFVQKVFSSNSFVDYKNKFFEDIYQKIENENIIEFVKTDKFKDSLEKTFINLSNSEDFKNQTHNILSKFMDLLVNNFNIVIPKEEQEKILLLLVESLVDSFENNSETFFKSLNIDRIVKREINDMNPKEIEDLFYSFAGKYFNTLILYGWLGGIIGILDALIVIFSK